MPAPVEKKLGEIKQVYRVRRNLRRNPATLALVLFGAGILAWLVAAGRAFVAYVEYGPLLVSRWFSIPFLIGLVLGLFASAFAFLAWRAARLRIRLHAGGLAVVRGRRGRAILWDDVRALWSRSVRTGLPGLPGRLHIRLEIEARDGQRLRLDDRLEDFASLAEAIKARIYPPFLEACSQAFNDGQTLDFGPLHLSQAGITDQRSMSYPWSAVSEARLASGRLVIRASREGKPAEVSIPAHRIPNVEVCTQLIEEIGRPL